MTATTAPLIELKSPDDLFRHLAQLSLSLLPIIKGYSDPPYSTSYVDAVAANQKAAEKLLQLWDAANKKGWRNIFTTNIISRERLTPEGAKNSLAFGNRGLLHPISRLAAKMVRYYPDLVWDANDPTTQKFSQQGIFGLLDIYDNNEVALDVILDRLEQARHPSFLSSRRDAHMAATHQMAVFLLQSNARYMDIEINPGQADTASIALVCAQLSHEYAAIQWVNQPDIEAGQQRAKVAESRALKLLPSQAGHLNTALQLAMQARAQARRLR